MARSGARTCTSLPSSSSNEVIPDSPKKDLATDEDQTSCGGIESARWDAGLRGGESGERTASNMYGARGWVAHHNTDLWRATAPIDGPDWGMWPAGGAWLCLHLWDRYEYGGDQAYLERVYPVMKGAAEFFVDTLVEDPKHHWLVTNPSLSPENGHPFGAACALVPRWMSRLFATCFPTARRGNSWSRCRVPRGTRS
jgi:hypothetical protein